MNIGSIGNSYASKSIQVDNNSSEISSLESTRKELESQKSQIQSDSSLDYDSKQTQIQSLDMQIQEIDMQIQQLQSQRSENKAVSQQQNEYNRTTINKGDEVKGGVVVSSSLKDLINKMHDAEENRNSENDTENNNDIEK